MTSATPRIIHGYYVGARVELHPATDAWMMGDRYGTVTKIGTKFVHIHLDRSGRVRAYLPANILGYTGHE